MNREFVKNHTHISAAQMRAVNNMDTDDLSYDDIALLHSVWKKADECSVCRARYDFAMESDRMLSAITPETETVSIVEKVADLLHAKMISLNSELQEKVSAWIDGAQELLSSLAQPTMQPVMVGAGARGTRGSDTVEIPLTPSESGTFDFVIVNKETKVHFTALPRPEDGNPVCLVIIGRNNTDFFSVYELEHPLADLGIDDIDSPEITLDVGEYTLCVPVINNN